MKKIIAILLVVLLVATMLNACGKEKTPENITAGTFSVGYGKADISPQKSVYLIGHNDPKDERMSSGVAEKMYATAVALPMKKGRP